MLDKLHTAFCILHSTAYCILHTAYCIPHTTYHIPHTTYHTSRPPRHLQLQALLNRATRRHLHHLPHPSQRRRGRKPKGKRLLLLRNLQPQRRLLLVRGHRPKNRSTLLGALTSSKLAVVIPLLSKMSCVLKLDGLQRIFVNSRHRAQRCLNVLHRFYLCSTTNTPG